MTDERVIAYFSMEIALEVGMPTYSGGLGVLAGDTIRSAADLRMPLVAVTLLYRKGYFRQQLDMEGWQHEAAEEWVVDKFLHAEAPRVTVTIEDRPVVVAAWRYDTRGVSGAIVPVYFLDTNLPENAEQDRGLTDTLYGGDARYRLCQEVVLGIGGVKMLRALGHTSLRRFHMNEGHASLLTLELLDEHARLAGRTAIAQEDLEVVRQQCVFTTHTPVPAGHDAFPLDLTDQVLRRPELKTLPGFSTEGMLNMTSLALALSRFVNGVAKRHAEVSRLMFSRDAARIESITNGVHPGTWASPPMQELFDRYIPGWRADNFTLRHAHNIPKSALWEAHTESKQRLLHAVNAYADAEMDVSRLTLGFARRATAYKRADLFFREPERLKQLAARVGPIQIVYAGKSHPHDEAGKKLIQRIIQIRRALGPHIKVAYLENYNLDLGKLLTAGVDVWLNTPQPPLEASGTSGMKAAVNGVPSLSVLDGWWVEGHIEGVTGWSVGEPQELRPSGVDLSANDANSLYQKLEFDVMPMFYRNRERFQDVMRFAIAFNGSFFNTQRMVEQYVVNAYFR
jgi:starch phosphorylase